MNSGSVVPLVRLADVAELTGELAQRVRLGGFLPEVVVYIETGARLVAWEVCRIFGVPGVPVTVKRGGHGLKRWLGPVLRRLPRFVSGALRRFEERSGLQRATGRTLQVESWAGCVGRRVLIVDDAADTGRTLARVREALLKAGARVEDIRTAVLACTTAAARPHCDFFVLERNCCLPWSPDSPDQAEALEQFKRCIPPRP